MKQKASMWIVIFFLIITFILINTITTETPIEETNDPYSTTVTTKLPHIGTQIGILSIIITTLLFIAYHHHHAIHNKEQAKPTPQHKLDQYVRESLLEGQEDANIKAALIKAGWQEKIIDQCLRRARFF